jgi:hypothetical protein
MPVEIGFILPDWNSGLNKIKRLTKIPADAVKIIHIECKYEIHNRKSSFDA